jgi:ADP-heptose:LPS heptosyltransferase
MGPHVLVARTDSEGDVLLAGPAVRAVAAHANRVTLLCGPRGEAAARLLPGVDDVVVWRIPWIDPEPPPVGRGDVLELVDRLAPLDVDEGLILTSFHQSPLPLALVLRMAGVRRLAATSADYPGSLLDVRHRIGDDVHEVERSLSLAACLGYALPGGDEGRLAVRRQRERPVFRGDSVIVHPGASVPARAWSPQRHRELVAALTARGHAVTVTGGPAETELTGFVAGEGNQDVVDLGGRTTLAELAEVIAGACVLVSGNTGPAHLAAAVGTPVVSLYAPTVPAARWRPWAVPHVLLGHQDIPCAGCRARVCPFDGHPCLDVTVDDVVDAVQTLSCELESRVAA